jgi:hypothetical protein
MDTITITETGCYLDNHRGHYIQRDAIELAKGYGYITGEFEDFALAMYEEHNHEQGFPHEGMTELCDEAVNWLNSGQGECGDCDGTGQGIEGRNTIWIDRAGNKRCKKCTGTGRGERMAGQNFPPIIPEGYTWAFEDGDFGLWKYDEDGEFVIDQD